MNVILNLSNNILTETQYNQGFYDVDDSNKELLTEYIIMNLNGEFKKAKGCEIQLLGLDF